MSMSLVPKEVAAVPPVGVVSSAREGERKRQKRYVSACPPERSGR